MEGHIYCIVYRSVGSVGEVQGVQEVVCDGFEVGQDKALKRLHHHRGHGIGSVVLWSFLGTGMMVEDLKQSGTWQVSREVLKMSVNTGDS